MLDEKTRALLGDRAAQERITELTPTQMALLGIAREPRMFDESK